jgi:hypothetical protein
MKIKKVFFVLFSLTMFIFVACSNDSTKDLEEVEIAEEGTRVFDESGFGFTVSYPNNWIYETDGFLVVFSGPENTDEYFTTINIQNLIKGEGGYSTLEDIYKDYKEQFLTVNSTRIGKMEYEIFEQDNAEYPMMVFDVEYERENENFKQTILVIERPGQIYHQFSYTAPVDLYELSEGTADRMFESFKMVL